MKPNTTKAMQQLIGQIKQQIPFNLPVEKICAGDCYGCPKKLLLYLECEIENWQHALDNKEIPKLGDIQKLAKTSKKIYAVLDKNGLIAH
jgi:hypothetical protein